MGLVFTNLANERGHHLVHGSGHVTEVWDWSTRSHVTLAPQHILVQTTSVCVCVCVQRLNTLKVTIISSFFLNISYLIWFLIWYSNYIISSTSINFPVVKTSEKTMNFRCSSAYDYNGIAGMTIAFSKHQMFIPSPLLNTHISLLSQWNLEIPDINSTISFRKDGV